MPASNENLTIEERADVTQLQLIARNGKGGVLANAIAKFLKRKKPLLPFDGARPGGVFVCAIGPEEYWAVIEKGAAAKERKELERITGDYASIFDQTDGRFVIRLSGQQASDLLARGTSLDLRDTALPMEMGTNTTIEHIPAVVLRRKEKHGNVFEVSVPRSYAGSFMTWLRGD